MYCHLMSLMLNQAYVENVDAIASVSI